MSGPRRVVLLGYGALLRSLLPGIQSMAPKAQIHGVKGSPQGLAALREQTPFSLSAGDGAARLAALTPAAVLFAPPPRQAAALCRQVLAPHWLRQRQAGQPLPLLMSFVPQWLDYAALLGPDAPVCLLLPGATQSAGGHALGPWGRSLGWKNSAVTPVQLDWAQRLLAPSGAPVWVPPSRLPGNLAVLVGAYLAQQLCALFPPAELRAGFGLEALPAFSLCAPSPQAEEAARGFLSGIQDFIAGVALPAEEAQPLLLSTLQTCLCAAQTEPPEELVRRFQRCATPGGLLEAGFRLWSQAPREDYASVYAGAYGACTAIYRKLLADASLT